MCSHGNQDWKQGDRYIRIVDIERLSVDYKAMPSITSKEGERQQVTKKELCRLLTGAVAAESV